MNRLATLKRIQVLLDRLTVDRLLLDEQQSSALPHQTKREQELMALLCCIGTTVRNESLTAEQLRGMIKRLVQTVVSPPIVVYDRRKRRIPVTNDRRRQP
jgi:hypothetical protein